MWLWNPFFKVVSTNALFFLLILALFNIHCFSIIGWYLWCLFILLNWEFLAYSVPCALSSSRSLIMAPIGCVAHLNPFTHVCQCQFALILRLNLNLILFTLLYIPSNEQSYDKLALYGFDSHFEIKKISCNWFTNRGDLMEILSFNDK